MVPVTIVTGSLGAGKTTLLNHLLRSEPERRLGVLVNDFGAINIDGRLIASVAGTGVVALTNGCICCSMKQDVVKAVFQVLEHATPPEHLLVEASGVSNPGALAEIFLGLEKSRVLRLDGIAVVLDAETFPYTALKTEPLARDQVLAADLVLLNKIDLVDQARLDAIEAAIRARVPAARVVRVQDARVPPAVLLGLGGAKGEIAHGAHPAYQSFALETGPFDFKRLAEVIRSFPPGVVRTKGIIAVVERPGDHLALNCVGRRIHVETIGKGAARSELVVIGTDFDEAALRAALLDCVLGG